MVLNGDEKFLHAALGDIKPDVVDVLNAAKLINKEINENNM